MRSQQQYRQRPATTAAPMSSPLTLGRKHKADYSIIVAAAILLAIGLILVYAIGPALGASKHVSNSFFLNRQLLAIALSVFAFLFASRVPLQWWKHAYKPLLLVAIGVTVLAMVMPVNPAYPAHRWVRLGSFSFQSVEVVKFAIMIWLAGFLAERIYNGNITDFSKTLQPIIIALGAIALIVAGVQSDLGSFGVIVIMTMAMVMIAGVPIKRLLMVGLALLVVATLFISSTPYRRSRVETLFKPESKCQTTGYQACQALIAVGSGGIIGLGLGGSVQAYGYLPEAANDSIFAIYAEKFGLIGSLLLMAIFVWFFSRLKIVAELSTDDFTRLLVVGVLAWLSSQAAINIGAMVGLFPLKGITLPLISYGGTSVVFVAAAIGLVFQASQYTAFSLPRETSTPRNNRSFRSSTPEGRAVV